jgi:hypothetical protein
MRKTASDLLRGGFSFCWRCEKSRRTLIHTLCVPGSLRTDRRNGSGDAASKTPDRTAPTRPLLHGGALIQPGWWQPGQRPRPTLGLPTANHWPLSWAIGPGMEFGFACPELRCAHERTTRTTTGKASRGHVPGRSPSRRRCQAPPVRGPRVRIRRGVATRSHARPAGQATVVSA